MEFGISPLGSFGADNLKGRRKLTAYLTAGRHGHNNSKWVAFGKVGHSGRPLLYLHYTTAGPFCKLFGQWFGAVFEAGQHATPKARYAMHLFVPLELVVKFSLDDINSGVDINRSVL